MINMLHKVRKNHTRFSSKEEGLSVVEVMIAFIVIAIVLIATAMAMTSSFRSAAYTENRSRAAGYAAEVVAIAKQSDFKQLYVATQPNDGTLFGAGKCSMADQTTLPPGSTSTQVSRVTTGNGDPYEGLVYCQARQAGNEKGGVGSTFYIQTKVFYLLNGTEFTGTSPAYYYPKRVYVEVKWQDVSSGEGKTNSYITSYTRSPNPKDCIPDRIAKVGSIPAGCRP